MWLKGIWLGKRFGIEEHLIGTTEGTIVRSAAVKPHPEIAWDSELFDAIRGTPWNPTCRPVAGEVVPEAQVPPLPRVVIPRSELEVPEPRRAKITRACIRRFGYSDNCSKCRALEVGDESQPGLAHSSACRERIEVSMARDPLWEKKLHSADRRRQEFMEKRADGGDESAKRVRVVSEPVRGGMFQNVPLNNPKRQLKMPRKRFQSQSEMMKMSRPPSDPENNLNRKMQQKIPLNLTTVRLGCWSSAMYRRSICWASDEFMIGRRPSIPASTTSASCSAKLELPKRLVLKGFEDAGAWTSTMSTRSRAVDGTLASRRSRRR